MEVILVLGMIFLIGLYLFATSYPVLLVWVVGLLVVLSLGHHLINKLGDR